jgi:hypothetical protein
MVALSGCAVGGAPSMPFFGAYFPGWMLAALVGVVVAVLAKLALVATGLQAAMPWQLAVCAGIGLIAAIAVDLLAFG